jgi:hypothetical protein
MKSQLNWNNKITEIQIITNIVRVSEHFSKMLVLSGVFNTITLDTLKRLLMESSLSLNVIKPIS